jgi:cbb3-type cytochrome c oxidase subunit III
MKEKCCVAILAIGVLLLMSVVVYSHPLMDSPGAAGTDSTQNYCKEVFLKNCSGCHGPKGQGDARPNLTDKYWLHGGGSKNINRTIGDGVSGKGMINWSAVFTTEEIQQITACVLSLQGTNPPKAKKAEGEISEDQKIRPKETDGKK